MTIIYIAGALIFVNVFFNWTEKITAIRNGEPNSVLGYNSL